jgi:hypothetical protein
MLDLHAAVLGVSYVVAVIWALCHAVRNGVGAVQRQRRLYPHGIRIIVSRAHSVRGAKGGSGRHRDRHQASMPGPRSIVSINGSRRRS